MNINYKLGYSSWLKLLGLSLILQANPAVGLERISWGEDKPYYEILPHVIALLWHTLATLLAIGGLGNTVFSSENAESILASAFQPGQLFLNLLIRLIAWQKSKNNGDVFKRIISMQSILVLTADDMPCDELLLVRAKPQRDSFIMDCSEHKGEAREHITYCTPYRLCHVAEDALLGSISRAFNREVLVFCHRCGHEYSIKKELAEKVKLWNKIWDSLTHLDGWPENACLVRLLSAIEAQVLAEVLIAPPEGALSWREIAGRVFAAAGAMQVLGAALSAIFRLHQQKPPPFIGVWAILALPAALVQLVMVSIWRKHGGLAVLRLNNRWLPPGMKREVIVDDGKDLPMMTRKGLISLQNMQRVRPLVFYPNLKTLRAAFGCWLIFKPPSAINDAMDPDIVSWPYLPAGGVYPRLKLYVTCICLALCGLSIFMGVVYARIFRFRFYRSVQRRLISVVLAILWILSAFSWSYLCVNVYGVEKSLSETEWGELIPHLRF
ncbi:uncharacterized protein VTP21DRAFT_1347 [Calcarisporiella thermophila]|uniref:uncharacterized protein n=1 Tax=Calcarisporiella thermophila TaxID=911321 RepID=UPI0037449577